MKELFLSPRLSHLLARIYSDMEAGYDLIAVQLGHTCDNCPDNCCDSYFKHHTYCEWAYLWEGIRALPDDDIDRILTRAEEYVKESRAILAKGEQPQLMCPLNEDGRCILYSHRLMICRMHGIPAYLIRPDGKRLSFPGCFRCQEIVKEKFDGKQEPAMDRTGLYRNLAGLESELLGEKRHLYPKVKLTIAEMIVKGPPRIPRPYCERNKA